MLDKAKGYYKGLAINLLPRSKTMFDFTESLGIMIHVKCHTHTESFFLWFRNHGGALAPQKKTCKQGTRQGNPLQKLLVNTWFTRELSQNTSFGLRESSFAKTKKKIFWMKKFLHKFKHIIYIYILLFELTLLIAQIFEKSCSKKKTKHSVR